MNTYLQGESNYDKYPLIRIAGYRHPAVTGWEAIGRYLREKAAALPAAKRVIVVECYQGVRDEEILPVLKDSLEGHYVWARDCLLPEEEIDRLVYPDVTDDEVFGYLTRLSMADFFDPSKRAAAQKMVEETRGTVIVYGPGASLLCPDPDWLIYADMARWEIQQRFRKNEVGNLGVSNRDLKPSLQYKRAFFVDWRVCDRLKKQLMGKWDLVLDTNRAGEPKMVWGEDLRAAYRHIVTRPFRTVPFFDPGPWGGQWMKEYCDLDRGVQNYAWCFDGVPEENSLLLQFDEAVVETPAINLVFYQAEKLLGPAVQARFGDEFPIRFDFLDTMGGGNLSLQVHPTTGYIQEKFGMHYTQDESYYLLDAGADACVYLGLKETGLSKEMIAGLERARQGGPPFEAEKFVMKWPVKKHDHILIPAGTVHCSGANSMVLEISATPYIFTFKLWDWGRLGLDGQPRPINIAHGQAVIDPHLTPERVQKEMINICEPVAEGEGWREERTGLHEREFIETRRHWFTQKVIHHTHGTVQVLNLVEGREAIVESPAGAFEPFIVHYAETFIIPEAVKEYSIRPHGQTEGQQCATIKAFVRIKP